jgi:hypothetical protein
MYQRLAARGGGVSLVTRGACLLLCATLHVFIALYVFVASVLVAQGSPQATQIASQAQAPDSTWLQTLSRFVTVSGGASLLGELYTVPAGTQARRPPGTVRLSLQATLTLFEQISIPFELLLSTEQVQFRQPFNQFGIAPQIGKNVRLYGGYHTLTLSSLSAGDVRLLGGGADVKVGSFRFVGSIGQSQRALQPVFTPTTTASAQAFLAQPATFSQTLILGRVAFESDSGVVIGLNIVRGRDDASSLAQALSTSSDVPQARTEAKDALTASIDAKLPLFSRTVNIEAELGASRNGSLWAAAAPADCNFGIQTPVVSASNLRLDYAARLIASFDNPASPFSVRLRCDYVGPGYTTMGFPQLVNDRLEADIAPQLRLFDGKLTAGGSIGYATDNLLGDRATTAQRVIGSANVSAQITDEFGVDAQYQNYGIRVAPPPNYGVVQPMTPVQQLQTQQVFGMVSVAPRVSFQLGGYYHNVSLMASAQQFADANADTRRTTENSSVMARLLWNTTLQKLALTLNGGYTSNRSALAEFQATDVALTGAHPLLDGKITPSLTLGWTKSSESSGLDSRTTVTLRATYRLTKQIDLALNAQGNYYAYKPGGRSPSYAEAQVSIEVRQRF